MTAMHLLHKECIPRVMMFVTRISMSWLLQVQWKCSKVTGLRSCLFCQVFVSDDDSPRFRKTLLLHHVAPAFRITRERAIGIERERERWRKRQSKMILREKEKTSDKISPDLMLWSWMMQGKSLWTLSSSWRQTEVVVLSSWETKNKTQVDWCFLFSFKDRWLLITGEAKQWSLMNIKSVWIMEEREAPLELWYTWFMTLSSSSVFVAKHH
jgi:hypothetical protein